MSQREQYYDLQPSFNAGLISPDVANRTDLEKYRYALLKGRNVFVRPYGSVYRRPGMRFMAQCKYPDKKAILVEFNFSTSISYLLEFGHKYIRVFKDNVYLGVEVASPFEEKELRKLRFTQSGDTLFIASGVRNVQLLQRFNEMDWRMKEMDLTNPYFDILATSSGTAAQTPEETKPIRVDMTFATAGNYTFTPPISGEYTITLAGGGGAGAWYYYKKGSYYKEYARGGRGEKKVITLYLMEGTTYNGKIGQNGSPQAYSGTSDGVTKGGNGGSATFFTESVAGGPGGQASGGSDTYHDGENLNFNYYHNHTDGKDLSPDGQPGGYYDSNGTYHQAGTPYVRVQINTERAGGSTVATEGIASSSKTGTTHITSSTKNMFNKNMVGGCIKLWHDVGSETITLTSSGTNTSNFILVGKTWKVITHGKWGGAVSIQYSKDGDLWRQYRRYTSRYADGNGDFNASESGTVDEYTYMRIVTEVNAGTVTVDLTREPYTHEGYAQITGFNSDTDVTAKVIKSFGMTEATKNYAFSVWSPQFGYPRCVGFFQDRLVLASSKRYPYAVWMSRTGDYYNFSTEKAAGTVTDDSAIMLSLVNRKEFEIKHIFTHSDLILFTDGNEWIIQGNETVTPTKCTPKSQSTRGCEDVPPLGIGGRVVYIQRRGKTVRDFAYTFDTDNYDGTDLTILAKHLTQDNPIVGDCYQQDPNSMCFFVTENGTLNCLTYIADQKVFAWSQADTAGKFEDVETVTSGSKDIVYAVVKRNLGGKEVRTIEYFTDLPETDAADDYIMLDAAYQFEVGDRTNEFSGFELYAGSKVDVLGDGMYFKGVPVSDDGTIRPLPKNVSHVTVGLPYTSEIEVPNIELPTSNGTQQGRFKKVDEVILNLSHSQGGEIGNSSRFTDPIPYGGKALYSGQLKATMPNQTEGGYERLGRVYIKHDKPYPFELSSIVRVVSFGG